MQNVVMSGVPKLSALLEEGKINIKYFAEANPKQFSIRWCQHIMSEHFQIDLMYITIYLQHTVVSGVSN